MKLKDFITTVLVDIEEGVSNAARITGRYTYLKRMGFGNKDDDTGVEFNVAVTASGETSGKIGAEVLSIGGKIKGKISSEEISRIKFRIKVGDYLKKK